MGLATVSGACLGGQRQTTTPGWGDWPQVCRDSQHTAADVSLSEVSDGGTHWQTGLGDSDRLAGVAVLGNEIVAGGRRGQGGFLARLSLDDGALEHVFELSTPVVAPPILTENSIVSTCRVDSETGSIRAFDFDGTERWSHEVGGNLPAPPTLFDSVLFGGGTDGELYAIREGDGEKLWERTIEDSHQGGAVPAPPTVDETGLYVSISSSSAQGIYSLSIADGDTNWRIRVPRIRSVTARTADLLLVSYPTYEVVAFDVDSGKRRWSNSLHERDVSTVAVGHEMVVVATETAVYGLERESGEKRWDVPQSGYPRSQPVVAGRTVVVQSERGMVGYSVEGGEELWSHDQTSGIPIVPVEDGLLYSPDDSSLAAYTSYDD